MITINQASNVHDPDKCMIKEINHKSSGMISATQQIVFF